MKILLTKEELHVIIYIFFSEIVMCFCFSKRMYSFFRVNRTHFRGLLLFLIFRKNGTNFDITDKNDFLWNFLFVDMPKIRYRR